ncbi:MAG: histidine phosphatase family protein [Thermoleophilia bacterium]|nr:histidine phosphatase family protein [Thermoleophilia bacterium]
MPKRIYLIRHGETEGTAEGRMLGSTDQPLSDRGSRQVRRLAELLGSSLRTTGATWCVASPLLRAQQTAQGVAGPSGLAISTDSDLREMNFGAWEGLTSDEVEARFPGEQAQWMFPTGGTTFPDGESLGEFEERVTRAQKRILARPEELIVVFTHGGVVRQLVCGILGLGRDGYWLFAVQPASVTRIELYGEGAEAGAVLSELWSVHDWEVH